MIRITGETGEYSYKELALSYEDAFLCAYYYKYRDGKIQEWLKTALSILHQSLNAMMDNGDVRCKFPLEFIDPFLDAIEEDVEKFDKSRETIIPNRVKGLNRKH